MKLIELFKVFAMLFLWHFSWGQTQSYDSPSVSSLMKYNNYPVDYSTGIPNISIPLYSVPTRSKDVSINIGLNYHVSSIRASDEKNGDCGRGWTLTKGGTISRQILGTPDEDELLRDGNIGLSDIYQFNFLGFSGSFILVHDIYDTSKILAKMTDNEGENLHIEVNYNAQDHSIDGFVIYDTKGLKYVFGEPLDLFSADPYDFFIYVTLNPAYRFDLDPNAPQNEGLDKEIRYGVKSAFHLTEIYDSNNLCLVNYRYRNFGKIEEYHELDERNGIQMLSKIQVRGFGDIDFTLYHTTATFNENNRYTDVLIKDYHGNIVKKYKFLYSPYNVPNPARKLLEVREIAPDNTEEQTYKLEYAYHAASPNNYTSVDRWGYYNNTNNWCVNNGVPDPIDMMNGILQNITYPTGGMVYYDFEPNTFSYVKGEPIGADTNIGEDFFYATTGSIGFPDGYTGEWNMHNYIFQSNNGVLFNNPGVQTFTIYGSGPQKVYFKFHAEQYPSEPLEEGEGVTYLYPEFKVGTTILDAEENYGNDSNHCRGISRTLSPGTYNLELIANSEVATGSCNISIGSKVPLNEIKRYWYGGGVRIKSISYFTEVPENIYTATPDRKIDFNYNFPDDPSKSSGAIIWEGPVSGSYYSTATPIRYKNVSVHDSQTEGRTDYVFYSPIDFGVNNTVGDSRLGKLQKKKIYNEAGDLLQETSYSYNFDGEDFFSVPGEINISMNLGWIPVRDISTKHYSGNTYVETIDHYTYFINRQLKTHLKTSAIAGEFLETKYFYDEDNPSGHYNRSEPETVEFYRDNELISVAKTNYQKDWVDPNNPTSTTGAYLPSTIQSAKGSNALETKTKINLYDSMSHVLETEQENGIKTAYIWGYNDSQIIAKIEGIAYSAIPSALLTSLRSAANAVGSNYNETAVLNALDALRTAPALSQAVFTGYTYKPLIGISTIIDPRGRRMTYEYDEMNRLKLVKDHEGNILSENEYHTKPLN